MRVGKPAIIPFVAGCNKGIGSALWTAQTAGFMVMACSQWRLSIGVRGDSNNRQQRLGMFGSVETETGEVAAISLG